MGRINFNLFEENERLLYEYRSLYHIEQYIPELFPNSVIEKLQTLRRINLIVKQEQGVAEELMNSSGILMMGHFQRPERNGREALYNKLNNLLSEDGQGLIAWSNITFNLKQREDLLRFLNFIIQTDVPLKPIGYILAQKLKEDIFWEKYRSSRSRNVGQAVSFVDSKDILKPILTTNKEIQTLQEKWKTFRLDHAHWLSAEKRETMDGFSEENIFRCLNLIQKKKIARISGKEYYPIRVHVLDTEWLYRRRIPYLVARSKDDNTVVLLRLDQHTLVKSGEEFTESSWVGEREIVKKLKKTESKISGAYFYDENEYIRGKFGLTAKDIIQSSENKISIDLPYQTLKESIYRVKFKKNISIDEVELELLMRSCGEFVHFDKSIDIDSNWDSADNWKKHNAYDNTFENGTVDAEIGLANESNSWDEIHAFFTCINLAEKTKKEKDWEINIPKSGIRIWCLNATELDWLYTVLTENKGLAEKFFGIDSSIMSTIKEKLDNEPQSTFRLSEFCKKISHGKSRRTEPIWNQEFNVLSSNPFANDGMKTAFQCAKEHKILCYKFNNHKKNEKMDCEIFPYHFQITKDEKIQLIAYDLKKFKLLSINNFGSNDYSDITVRDLSNLSENAKLFLYHSFGAQRHSTSVPENKNEKLFAAREIVYYYKLLLDRLPGDLYTSDRYYNGKTLDTMLGKLKKIFDSIKEKSVFSPVTVNQKTFSICSRIIKGEKLWNNENRAMKKWSIEGWLDQYKFPDEPIQPLKSSDFSQQDKEKFNEVYAKAKENPELASILEYAFQHYQDYINTNMSDTDKNFAWNTDIYHPAQELKHIYHVLEKVSQESQRSSNTRSHTLENCWLKYLQDEIRCLNDAKQCTAILGIRGELSMERLDLIYHILNEFDLTTEAVVCNPDDFYSEDADEFEIVRCIRVNYSSYSFRKLHEGILALQDFIYPLAPVDLKEIIQKRENNMRELYGGITNEHIGTETV